MRTPLILAVATLPLLLPTAPALAIPSTLRTAEGRIVAVEPDMHRFTFERADNRKRFVLTWNRRTLFGQSAAAGGAAPLRAGQRARVGYRRALFGPDYAGRVVVLPAIAAPRQSFRWSSKSKTKRHP